MNDETPTPLFVRLPRAHASRLDRASEALGTPKKDLVAGLVARYVDPDTPSGLDALRELDLGARRVIIESGSDPLTVGHHSFRPTELPDVLTPAQAAALLQVDEAAVIELAERGELPARRIGDEWRIARPALIAWLSHAGGARG